jgi:GT2 family glycosyltransferase
MKTVENSEPAPALVSVVMINWNGAEHTRVALTSLRQHTRCPCEVFVVDNGSRREVSAHVLKEEFPWVTFLFNADNEGFSAASNRALRLARGKYLLLLNNDTVQIEDSISAAAEYMDSHSDVGVLGVRHLNDDLDRSHQPSAYPFPAPLSEAATIVGLRRRTDGETYEKEQDVDWLCGSFFMIRRQCLEQVGLLDERYFVYEEDVDYCRRAWRAGWRIRYWPGVSLVHKGAASKHLIEDKTFMHLRSRLTYLAKYHSRLEWGAYYAALSARLTASAVTYTGRAFTGKGAPRDALERWIRLARLMSGAPTALGLRRT